ncbi:hypothetical protein K4L06_06725 [Lysobacter sp. BMK333-48F3]|uniref:hypothetical protein n=1 Tax=Lysobacter sp. BMK333-48F3 TaxID=2867962 RepID=UPI001C8BD42E|nr:hypothetical protein [Lysobacter sp. BMK333-48F3]MBX9401002.1 hypothetical protein [Lysobacter sp. BMK333-48F3]
MDLVTVSGRGEAEERQRALVRAKSNLGPDGDGFFVIEAIEVAEGIPASMMIWQKALVGQANELMAQLEGVRASTSKTDEAASWLKSALSLGPKPSTALLEEAAQVGYTAKMIRGTYEKLGVAWERVGFGPGSHIVWRLPNAH